jgi:hypothetical protein
MAASSALKPRFWSGRSASSSVRVLLAGVRSSESRKTATDSFEMLDAGAPGGGSSPRGGTDVSVVVVGVVVLVESGTGSGTEDEVLVDDGAIDEVVVDELLELELVVGRTVVTVPDVGGVEVGT